MSLKDSINLAHSERNFIFSLIFKFKPGTVTKSGTEVKVNSSECVRLT